MTTDKEFKSEVCGIHFLEETECIIKIGSQVIEETFSEDYVFWTSGEAFTIKVITGSIETISSKII